MEGCPYLMSEVIYIKRKLFSLYFKIYSSFLLIIRCVYFFTQFSFYVLKIESKLVRKNLKSGQVIGFTSSACVKNQNIVDMEETKSVK